MKYKCTIEQCLGNEDHKCCIDCNKKCGMRCIEDPRECWRAELVEDQDIKIAESEAKEWKQE